MLFTLLFLFLFLLSHTATPALSASHNAVVEGTSGGATGKAYVTYCDTAAELGGCRRKLVVDLTLDDSTVAGSVLETALTVSAALDEAAFTPDEMAAAAAANATTTATLQVTLAPLRVDFRRGGVQMRYGLNYLRPFPGALRDYVQALRTAMTCDDGVTRCPAYTPLTSTTAVAAPLGVCCLCTSVECALSSELCNASMRTAFCFRTAAAGSICVKEDGVPYGGWAIQVGTPYYALNTTVSGAAVPTTSFPLTTDSTDLVSGAARMQLLRTSDVDMASAGLRLNVSQRVLFNPLTGARVSAGAAEWMLVPTSLVSVDGTACNKVGVTPEYFYSLSSASQCNAQTGTCLGNQLEDLRTADLAQIALGGGGSYLAAYLGSFTQQTIGGRRYLLDEVERSGGAALRWSMNADSFTFTPVAVGGSLVSAVYVAGTARVSVAVANSNAYAGLYYVTTENCTATTRLVSCGSGSTSVATNNNNNNIQGSSYKSTSAAAAKSCVTSLLIRGRNASAAVFQTWSAAADVGGAASCAVVLRDAANATLATTTVSWTVQTTTTTTAAPLTKRQRCAQCAFHDLHCLFSGVCEWQMLVWTVVALGVTWCPYAILAYWRVVWRICQKATFFCTSCRTH